MLVFPLTQYPLVHSYGPCHFSRISSQPEIKQLDKLSSSQEVNNSVLWLVIGLNLKDIYLVPGYDSNTLPGSEEDNIMDKTL